MDPGATLRDEPDPPATPAPGKPVTPPPDEPATMPLVDHLVELRRRLAISIIAVLLGSAIGFWLAPSIIRLLLTPLPGGEVVFLTLSGGFMVHLRVAIVVGILLALPLVLYQAWAFVAPGLTRSERRAALPWIPLSVVFFILGVLVAWVTLPYAVSFLLGFQIEDALVAMPSAEAYFGFVTFIFIIFGLVMEFPVVLVFLHRLGLLRVEQLRASRRYVLFGAVVFAVVITPGGDPISPIVLAGTMFALFELTILLLSRSSKETTVEVFEAADA